MKIGIIRHANVLYHDPLFTKGKAYDEGRFAYDRAAIEEVKFKISIEDFQECYSSSRQRAIQTAEMIYPEPFIVTEELAEVRNSAFFLQKWHLPSALRSVVGRAAWFFNNSKMPETRKQSNERAEKFLTRILPIARQNVLFVTHGFFMQSLRHELRKKGFRGHLPYFPKNARLYVFER